MALHIGFNRKGVNVFQGFSLKLIGVTAISLAVSVDSMCATVSQIDAVEQTYHLYSKHVIDDVVVEKRYSSNSEFRGLFGFGWCSDLDGRVDKYADQSIRYTGCDISTGMLLDPRVSAKEVVVSSTGYRRVREDGAIQSFDQAGRLKALRFPKASGREALLLNYFESVRPNQVIGVRSQIEIRYDRDFELIQTLHGRTGEIHFGYRLDLLVFNATETYTYTPRRALSRRTSSEIRETVDYEPGHRLVRRVEKRLRASPDERLLMSLVASGQSEEIQINAERGADLRPVRILYHMQRRTLDLIGDRETARRILDWLKS
jgi:hypothetical protein